jgi:hypothetical protein
MYDKSVKPIAQLFRSTASMFDPLDITEMPRPDIPVGAEVDVADLLRRLRDLERENEQLRQALAGDTP